MKDVVTWIFCTLSGILSSNSVEGNLHGTEISASESHIDLFSDFHTKKSNPTIAHSNIYRRYKTEGYVKYKREYIEIISKKDEEIRKILNPYRTVLYQNKSENSSTNRGLQRQILRNHPGSNLHNNNTVVHIRDRIAVNENNTETLHNSDNKPIDDKKVRLHTKKEDKRYRKNYEELHTVKQESVMTPVQDYEKGLIKAHQPQWTKNVLRNENEMMPTGTPPQAGMGHFDFARFTRLTSTKLTTTPWMRTVPGLVTFKEDCEYVAHYCLRVYHTGKLCAKTMHGTYSSFENYCMLDFVNCMEKYDAWQVVYMGECIKLEILSEFVHYPDMDDYFLDQYYIVQE